VPHVLAAVVLLGLPGCGSEGAPPEIQVLDAWARPRAVEMGAEGVVPGSTSAVYLEIRNAGPKPDRLLGGETPAATSVEVHESLLEGDVMRMRRVEGVDLPGGAAVALRPGGLHIMLLDLRQALQEGDTLSLTLNFQRSGPLSLRVPVRTGEQG